VAYHVAPPELQHDRIGDAVRTLLSGRRAASWLLLGFTCLAPAWARAQFDQYTSPGGPTERPRDRKELLQEYLRDARWRLGPLRVDPWFSLSDVEYVDNSFGSSTGEEADVTATAGAGLRAYLPAGPDVVVALHALPEYLWWKEQAARRRLNGRYGVGVFGFFNRVALEATASRTQQRGFASPEFPQLISVRSDRAVLGTQVVLSGHVSLFASAEGIAIENLLDREELADPRTAPFETLDRDERILRGGLRYHFPRRWSVGLGVERTEVDFDVPPGALDRSSSGTAPLLIVQHESKDTYLSLEVSQRSLDPEPGSVFVPYDETAFALLASFNTTGRLGWSVYGRRGIVYSLSAGYSYLQDDRAGLSFQYGLGWRTRLKLFAEAGRDDYTAETVLVPDRRDDTRAYGASVSFAAAKRALLTLRIARTELDSNLPGQDRQVTTFGAGLGFGGSRASW
jgi:hypothetical protein